MNKRKTNDPYTHTVAASFEGYTWSAYRVNWKSALKLEINTGASTPVFHSATVGCGIPVRSFFFPHGECVEAEGVSVTPSNEQRCCLFVRLGKNPVTAAASKLSLNGRLCQKLCSCRDRAIESFYILLICIRNLYNHKVTVVSRNTRDRY